MINTLSYLLFKDMVDLHQLEASRPEKHFVVKQSYM